MALKVDLRFVFQLYHSLYFRSKFLNSDIFIPGFFWTILLSASVWGESMGFRLENTELACESVWANICLWNAGSLSVRTQTIHIHKSYESHKQKATDASITMVHSVHTHTHAYVHNENGSIWESEFLTWATMLMMMMLKMTMIFCFAFAIAHMTSCLAVYAYDTYSNWIPYVQETKENKLNLPEF